MEIEYTMLKRGDESVLDRVAEDVFDQQVDPARLMAYLSEPGHHLMVALADGQVVAQVAAVVHRHPDQPTELYIDNVGVTPSLHRRGIARAMLDLMFEFGRSIGCEEVWVGTELDNQPGRRLYESRGARPETFVMYVYEL